MPEPDRDFDVWLAVVNDDINTALERHAVAPPHVRTGQEASRHLRPVFEDWTSSAPAATTPGGSSHENAVRPNPELAHFLTVAEVAGLMRVSKMTVYHMVHSGELVAVRVGRSFRVPTKAVRDYLAGSVELDGAETHL